MAFWSQKPDKEPKRNFRFKVKITGLGGEAEANGDQGYLWFAKTATKPSFTINAAEHKFLNHTFYYPGAVTWNDVTITLVDPQNPDSVLEFAKLIQEGGYRPPGTQNDLATMSKARATNNVGDVIVAQLDADGNEIENWKLWNAFITDIKFGDNLEYGNDDLTEVSVTFKYDWAQLETPANTGNPIFKAGGSSATS